MGDVAAMAAAAAAVEGVLHRRIEFHAARRSHVAAAVGGVGFRMETLNPEWNSAALAAAAEGSEGEGRRPEKRDVGGGGGGLDPDLELSVARFYLGRIGAGLQNLGNTCYLNSVLQCLTYTEPFAAYLQSGKHKSSCRAAGFCALCALQNHVRTALQSTGKIVTPSQFVKNLRCISRSFRNYRQEDAHELMVNLLESMHKCCLPSGVPSESPSAYEKSLVHRIFGGRLRSQVRCTRCSHCSNKFDPFLDLSLDIAKATTLVRALQKFTEEELLDGGEKQYQCQRCRQKVVAKKKFTIDKPPYVLTIHLKRFNPINPRVKIDKRVAFQPTLDLKPFISDSEGTDFKYSLYGVLVHAGLTTQAGHYYCFVRTSSGMWHNLDDNKVRQVREADVLQQEAYMLFYVRDRVRSSRACKDNGTANVPGKRISEISYLNGVIENDVIKTKLNGPSFTSRNMKLQNISNGHSSIVSNTSAGQSSKNEGFEAAASQSNGMSSAQKAPFVHRNDGAAFSTKSKQTALSSQKEIQFSGQPECPANASGSQKLGEMSMLEPQPKADSAATHSGKNYVAASLIPNGATRLFETDKQTSEPQTTQLSEPTSCLNDTLVTAQIVPTKDGIVSNGIISSSGGDANSEKVKNSAESQKKHGETVMVKELPMHKKNSTSPEIEWRVNFEKHICSEDSIRNVAVDSGHGNRPKKIDLKSKKLVRYPVINMCFGPKQLLITSLKLRKKRKHKRTKKSMICKDVANIAGLDDSTNEQQTSTSGTVLSETVECKFHGLKRAHAGASSGNGSQTVSNTEHFSGASDGADDHNLGIKCSKNATFVGAELPKLGPSSSANQPDSRNNADANGAVYQHVSLLTRGLTEVTVPSWDDNEKPNTKTLELTSSRSSSIGYVLDEWDEEYDQGKRKKVRQSKEDFGGPNPFQEKADIRSRKRLKLKADQARSFNQPIRLEELRL